MRKALAGLGYVTLTAGGDFHPALRTLAARDERPEVNYGERRLREQGPSPWESACPHYLTARLQAAKLTIKAGHTARAKSEFGAPDSQPANPIPVCSHGNR
jgi:hypothetical protein